MFFEKNKSKLEKFLSVSTFKSEEERDRDYDEMVIEQKKLLKREEKRKNEVDKPKPPVNTVTTMMFKPNGDPIKVVRDLTNEEKHFEGMMERGNFTTEKPHGKYLGDGQPKREIITYTNYNEIEIEVVPEGVTGKKWKQIKREEK